MQGNEAAANAGLQQHHNGNIYAYCDLCLNVHCRTYIYVYMQKYRIPRVVLTSAMAAGSGYKTTATTTMTAHSSINNSQLCMSAIIV
ncbi:unnamed protein product [Ceratitis capitata]|uniref:(Mediterranean fruit fly) hypothetical protein n=1 Tax=Ceratitis capitata TaxID=7213 RepID=A0A811V1Z7_CERCA|nr:unnamed protein product [Ceratitis capitata]